MRQSATNAASDSTTHAMLRPEKPVTTSEDAKASASRKNGAPGRIRTSDHQVRSLVLYPTELRARTKPCIPCDADASLASSAVALPPRPEAELFGFGPGSSIRFRRFREIFLSRDAVRKRAIVFHCSPIHKAQRRDAKKSGARRRRRKVLRFAPSARAGVRATRCRRGRAPAAAAPTHSGSAPAR